MNKKFSINLLIILSFIGIPKFALAETTYETKVSNQTYSMPCGSVGEVYIKSAEVGSLLKYPMAKYSDRGLSTPVASRPTDKYIILSRDAEAVIKGSELPINIDLNTTTGEYKVLLYCDWDRDGNFEFSKDITADTSRIETKISVPEDALEGKTRLRIRVTDNDLTGADDDTHGEILDLLLNVYDKSSEMFEPAVNVNDPARGSATWENGLATATAKGASFFLYWNENHRVLSLEEEYQIPVSEYPRTLTAYFSPSIEEAGGIEEILLYRPDKESRIVVTGDEIKVLTSSTVKFLAVFSVNGMKVASSTTDTVTIPGLPQGIYIIKAVTEHGTVSSKLKI